MTSDQNLEIQSNGTKNPKKLYLFVSVTIIILFILACSILYFFKSFRQPSVTNLPQPNSSPVVNYSNFVLPTTPSSTTIGSTAIPAGINNSCFLESGPNDSIFKVFIISNGELRFFKEEKDQIVNEFKNISPFNNYFNRISFYVLKIPPEKKVSCQTYSMSTGLQGGLACDSQEVDKFISNECGITDTRNFIKIIKTESTAGGSGGEIITLGTNPENDLETDLALGKGAIHEVAHNMGLGDLYSGGFQNNGDPIMYYSNEVATMFPNTDVAGCPKWCKSYKQVSSYSSITCPAIKNESSCRAEGRNETGQCQVTFPNPNSTTPSGLSSSCCVWSNEGFDYFGKCAPALGKEDIGIDCLPNTGCFFGASYGNNAWRPVKEGSESIMYSTMVDKFDPVSERWLFSVLECCMTKNDSTKCSDFKKTYTQYISKIPGFKQNIGYCMQNN